MKPKVFLFSAYNKWAIGDDLLQTKRALQNIVEFTDLAHAEVVHCVWWEEILGLDVRQLMGKRIVCHMSGEPSRYLKLPRFAVMPKMVGLWISQSTEAKNQLNNLGLKNVLIPYVVDTEIFKPTIDVQDIVEKWKIPSDKYLICNFHRDTEGSDLISPKLVKGPDIFLEIVNCLHRTKNIHVILAGPRRFWIKNQLSQHKISYSFIGKEITGDDMSQNVLPQDIINKLYNISDLCVISSRSEGGPRTLIEAIASKCKVISTDVGLARDVLCDKNVYSTANEACLIVKKDIEDNFLGDTIELQYEKMINNNTLFYSIPIFKKLYDEINDIPLLNG